LARIQDDRFPSLTGPKYRPNRALADYWNGRRWAFERTVTPLSIKSPEGVSCVPGGTCEIVGHQAVGHSFYTQMLAEGT
jgi:hypothetical protein